MEIIFPLMGLSGSRGVRSLIEHANGLAIRGHRAIVLVARPSRRPSFPLDERLELKQATVHFVLTDKGKRTEMEEQARRYVSQHLAPEVTYGPFLDRIRRHVQGDR